MLDVAVIDLVVCFEVLLLDEFLRLMDFGRDGLVLNPAFVLLLYPRPIDFVLFLHLLGLLDLLKDHRLWLKDFRLRRLRLILLDRHSEMVHLDASFERYGHRTWVSVGLLLTSMACVTVVALLAAAANRLMVGTTGRMLVLYCPYV